MRELVNKAFSSGGKLMRLSVGISDEMELMTVTIPQTTILRIKAHCHSDQD